MSSPSSGDWPDPYAPSPGVGSTPEPPAPQAFPPAAYATPGGGPPGYGAYPGYAYQPAPPTNGMAIASLVCSLAGIATGISAPVGAILGHVARRQIRERGEQGAGMALAGVIVGWIFTGIYGLCCVGYITAIGFAISQSTV